MLGASGPVKSNMVTLPTDRVAIDHDLIKSFFLENNTSLNQSPKMMRPFDWIPVEDMVK